MLNNLKTIYNKFDSINVMIQFNSINSKSPYNSVSFIK